MVLATYTKEKARWGAVLSALPAGRKRPGRPMGRPGPKLPEKRRDYLAVRMMMLALNSPELV